MEIRDVIRRRRMTRRFGPTPIEDDVVRRLLSEALLAPSAGSSHGVDFILLDTPEDRDNFHSLTTVGDWYEISYQNETDGILNAPVLVVPVGDPARYVERYALSDKLGSSLSGVPAEEWPTPYWLVDAAFATMQLLLLAEDAGLGALFHRLHRDPADWLASIGAPSSVIPIGAVALGLPAGQRPQSRQPAPTSRSTQERIHHALW
jgi:nitroreductase